MYLNSKKGGISIIGVIFLAVIVIVALNYFHLSLHVSIENTGPGNSVSGGGVLTNIWNTFLAGPVSHLWNDYILKYLWQPFLDGMKSNSNVGQQNSMNLAPAASP